MARNNRQRSQSDKQFSANPGGKTNKQHFSNPTNHPFNNQPTNIPNPTNRPSQCQTCGKLHKGECRHKNATQQPRPTNNCSYCSKKGHDESVCYKKNPRQRQKTPPAKLFTKSSLRIRRGGRWETPLKCHRERNQSAVSFPLTLAGTMALPPLEYEFTSNVWIEDSDHDVIMCLHDCRSGGNFCCRRFAVKCANQLKQSVQQLNPGITNSEYATLVISQRDEEALRQTMISYGVLNNSFGESTLMDVDEVF